MNLLILGLFALLLILIPSFAFSVSVDETILLMAEGDRYFIGGDYEKAISIYDKVLEIDPNNFNALNNMGGALIKFGKADEALQYLFTAVKNDPTNEPAKHNLQTAANAIGYKPAEGMFEMIVRDADGNLIAYLATHKILLLDHEASQNTLGLWPLKKIITRDGQDYEIRQKQQEVTVEVAKSFSNFGFPFSHTKVWGVMSTYHQIPVQVGDKITFIFTILQPIE